MGRSKGLINNIKLLLELHHTTVKQSSDEHLVWLLGELHTSYYNEGKRWLSVQLGQFQVSLDIQFELPCYVCS